MEHYFEFRQRMLCRHRYDLRTGQKQAGQAEIDESYIIAISKAASRVIENAALDLQDFLRRCMDVSLAVKRFDDLNALGRNAVIIRESAEAGQTSGACLVRACAGKLELLGADDRGAAQAVYRAEDMMTANGGPWLNTEVKTFVPQFPVRMTHSGYGLDDFPDAHLASIAHAGMNAILVFVKGVDLAAKGYEDFNTLIWRANGFGLDVYAYSYFRSEVNPEDPAAYDHYNGTYGKLFQNCPGFKGVVIVGESCAFPSKDPRVAGTIEPSMEDGIPTGKPRSGWFPCADYPQWISYVRGIIEQYKPDVDFVFWTYNWGNAPVEDRVKLVENLPKGTTLLVTFETDQDYEVDGVAQCITDYSICHPGPGQVFKEEAEAAKRKGIRLYTQANAAGLAWDFGVVPYDPFPAGWHRRYDALLKAKEEYGLVGIMESHHYGFYPSFISAMETMRFQEGLSAEEAMKKEAVLLYGEENAEAGLEAWHWLDEALHHYFSTNEEQYGPARVGPAYPLIYQREVEIPRAPYSYAGGNTYCFPDYGSDILYYHTQHTMGASGCPQFRFEGELKSLDEMRRCLSKAVVCLTVLESKLTGWRLEECGRLTNLAKYLDCCALTIIHAKQWHQRRWQIKACPDANECMRMLREMIEIGRQEVQNAADTLPLLEYDSRLGWEPSMEYNGGIRNVKWKMKQVTQVIEQEIPAVMEHLEAYLNR